MIKIGIEKLLFLFKNSLGDGLQEIFINSLNK